MTEESNNLSVAAPEKWMAGWDNYFKKMLEQPDEALAELGLITPPVQVLAGPLHGKKEGLKGIDLACGHGSSTLFLAKNGVHMEAIDALASAIEVVNKRANLMQLKEKVNAYQKDIDGWDIKPESYDIVIATQCLQYLFDRAIPRLQELAAAVKPGGFLVYSGNVPPHFKLEPPMKFIYQKDLDEIFKGWVYHSKGTDERLMRPGDLRGYIWLVAQKPDHEKEEKS